MNPKVIRMQVLFLIWRDRVGDQCDSEIRRMICACMLMSIAAPPVIPVQGAAREGGRPEQ